MAYLPLTVSNMIVVDKYMLAINNHIALEAVTSLIVAQMLCKPRSHTGLMSLYDDTDTPEIRPGCPNLRLVKSGCSSLVFTPRTHSMP